MNWNWLSTWFHTETRVIKIFRSNELGLAVNPGFYIDPSYKKKFRSHGPGLTAICPNPIHVTWASCHARRVTQCRPASVFSFNNSKKGLSLPQKCLFVLTRK